MLETAVLLIIMIIINNVNVNSNMLKYQKISKIKNIFKK